MSITPYFRLIRFGNCLLAVAGVLVGAYLTAGLQVTTPLWITSLGVFFICAGGNVVNDIVDRDSDIISHPDRPLPAGEISHHAAVGIAVVIHVCAIVLILMSEKLVGIIGAGAVLLLLGYNLSFKRIPVVGNLVVALLAGLPFVCGGFSVDNDSTLALPGPLIAAAFALLFHLIREIVKDVEDMEGDRVSGGSSLALWLGERAALGVALGLYLLLAVVTMIPYVMAWYGLGYVLIVICVLNIPLTTLLVVAFWHPTPIHLTRARRGLKAGMVVGLVALLVA